jgi:clan AA aspartic protease
VGTFSVPIQVGDPAGQWFIGIEALVDTGASDTFLPRSVLEQLGIQPVDRFSYRLADERTVEYDVGEARIRLDGRERTTQVVFGPEGVTPLLGATTLEIFHLGVDPVERRLIPVPGLLKGNS